MRRRLARKRSEGQCTERKAKNEKLENDHWKPYLDGSSLDIGRDGPFRVTGPREGETDPEELLADVGDVDVGTKEPVRIRSVSECLKDRASSSMGV